jgi:hypothetical protein
MTLELGSNVLTLRTYYNPTVPGWYLDIEGYAVGLALVPFVNALEASPQLSATLGQFRAVPADGSDVINAPGETSLLWWFAPGEWLDDESPATDPLPADVLEGYRVD